MNEPSVVPAPGKILTPEQDATIKRINALPLGQRIEAISKIQSAKEAVAVDQAIVPELAIWARQQAEACRGVLTAMPHPLIPYKSLEHFQGQLNAMVVLLFESAARWGIEFDAVMAAGKPVFDLENEKRLARLAEEAKPKAVPDPTPKEIAAAGAGAETP